mmetsp:Transcript_7928/g.11458  ORF Transcript_7928/g.11458 Transcript_7928/m.11458 type:complete len:102 (-) Transcript_7928:874-1179(-)
METICHEEVSYVYVFCSLVLEALPCFSNNTVLLLSCSNTMGASYPCPSRKYLVHSTCPILSFTAISSVSVELIVFIFCLEEDEYAALFPKVITVAVCPHMS